MCPTPPQFLGSTSQDRYFRLHSTFSPPESAGRNQENRGEILGSVFMKAVPTAIVCDATYQPPPRKHSEAAEDDGDGSRKDDKGYTGPQTANTQLTRRLGIAGASAN